jgi:hypothetical protein
MEGGVATIRLREFGVINDYLIDSREISTLIFLIPLIDGARGDKTDIQLSILLKIMHPLCHVGS